MTSIAKEAGVVQRAARLARLDEAHVAHALTRLDAQSARTTVLFERAQGVRLWDTEGREWLDGFAGSQNVSLGYGRPEISAAVKESLDELSAGNLFHGRGHPRVVELAEMLASVTPSGIERFFFSVTGSDAVESAVAIARYANAVQGRPEKNHIIGRRFSYHGLNYGSRSITGQPAIWEGFGPLLPGVSHISYPTPAHPDAAVELEHRILELGPENVAAFLAEPVSIPSGAVIPPDAYWPQVREICSKHDVLLIVDEVASGFGRTGELFAISNWDVRPDLILMAKAINNGAIPMGAVGMTEEVYERLISPRKVFWHGYTGGGNPAACAAALATLRIFEDEAIVQRARTLSQCLKAELAGLAARAEGVSEVRVIGMLSAIDLVDGTHNKTPGAATRHVAEKLEELRLLARGYGAIDSIIFAPALTVTKEELTEMVARLEEAVQSIEL